MWVYFKIFMNSYQPKHFFKQKTEENGLTQEGNTKMITVEKRIRDFVYFFRKYIGAYYLFHYAQSGAEIWRESLSEWGDETWKRTYTFDIKMYRIYEYIRFRFLVERKFNVLLKETFEEWVMPVRNKETIGSFFFENYNPTGDIGVRFGDLSNNINPTTSVAVILTGNTELRFCMLDHPDFPLNHDIIHLYFNTMGYNYPMEKKALQARIKKIDQMTKKKQHQFWRRK